MALKHRVVRAVALVLCLFSMVPAALAGTLDRAALETYFPSPLILGEKDEALPVWPIFKQNGTKDDLIAYVFESIDLAPIPGFSGTPFNLLVALTPEGQFMEVRVLSQHEPVFVDGLGPQPLFEFVKQYEGTSLKQTLKVSPPGSGAGASDAAVAEIRGVAKATASVRVVNETLLVAGLEVARRKLGFAKGRDPSQAAKVRMDTFKPMTWQQLTEDGFVRHFNVTNRDSEAPFAGTVTAGLDPEVRKDPDGAFIDLWVGALDVPTVGKNLLGGAAYDRLIADLDGRHALLVLSTGRQGMVDDAFVSGAIPVKVALMQADLPVEVRDFAWRKTISMPGMPSGEINVLTIKTLTGWDPATAAQFVLRASRQKGQILPEIVTRDFAFPFLVPTEALLLPPKEAEKGLIPVWRERLVDCAVLSGALVLLGIALLAQRYTTASTRGFAVFRRLYLLFTLVVIGWWMQAQLSIVTLTGFVKAAKGEGGMAFLLYDPPSVILWGVTLLTLIVWGRGTFCGWLCPFGALQEFVGDVARVLKIRQIRLSERLEQGLRFVKYVVLAGILATAYFYSPWAERVAEVEPFKTAITLVFWRSWPYVAWAVALLAASLFVYKFFCRFLCPLGAAFALIGLLRQWNWLPRREECGSPCRLCQVRCRYDAIRPSGEIIYHECFQCMDCVVIHNDRRQCVPLILADRGRPGTIALEAVSGGDLP